MKKLRILFLTTFIFLSMISTDCISLKRFKELENRVIQLEATVETHRYKLEKLETVRDRMEKKIEREEKKAVNRETAKNTGNPVLKKELDEKDGIIQKHEKELDEISKQPPHIERDERISEIKASIDRLIEEEYRAIEDKYRIYRIDFIKFDNKKILPEGKKILENLVGDFNTVCQRNKKILVFGFGCDIGTDEKIKKISKERAENIADWIDKNAKCSNKYIIYEGLGIGLKDEDTKNSSISKKELEEIRSKSRHADILVPKLETLK